MQIQDFQLRRVCWGLFFLALIVNISRDYLLFTAPSLRLDDGSHIFAFYYNDPHWTRIFRYYAGYISILPNLFGYISMLFPVIWAPYLITCIPLVVAAISQSLFASATFRNVIPSDTSRIVCCFIVILMPWGNFTFISSIMFSLWNLFLIQIFYSLKPLALKGKSSIILFVVLSTISWSHPFSVTLIPIYGLWLVKKRSSPRHVLFYSGLISIILGYVFFGIERTDVLSGTLPSTVGSVGALLLKMNEVILYRTIANMFFSNKMLFLLSFHPILKALLLLISLGMVFGSLLMISKSVSNRFRSLNKLDIFIIVYLIVSFSLIYIIKREVDYLSIYDQRYYYLQKILIVIALIPIFEVGFRNLSRKFQAAATSGVIFLILVNNYFDNFAYYQDLKQSNEISELVQNLRQQEIRNKGRNNIHAFVDRDLCPIIIDR